MSGKNKRTSKASREKARGGIKDVRPGPVKNLSEEEKIVLRERIVEAMAVEGVFTQKDWRLAHEEGRVPSVLPKYPEYDLQPMFPGWRGMGLSAMGKRKDGGEGLPSRDPRAMDLRYWTLDGWMAIVKKAVEAGEISDKKDYGPFRRKKAEEGVFLSRNPDSSFPGWPGWAKVLGLPDPFAGAEGAEEFRKAELSIALLSVETGGDLLRPSSRPLSEGWLMEENLLNQQKMLLRDRPIKKAPESE
jgi:hypothetical protein